MPITTTWNPRTLTNAANAEGLTFEQVQKLMAGLRDQDVRGLVDYAKETDMASLKDWQKAFTSIFAKMNDAESSAVIRIAITLSGGVVI